MEFRILGPLTIETPDGLVDVRGPKRRALCAFLLLHAGSPVPLDRIIDELWGEDTGGAAGTVQTYVSQLRKVLTPAAGAAITTAGGGYCFDIEPGDLDASRFADLARRGLDADDPSTASDTLRDALACWRGPALAEFRGAAWADAAAEPLELQRLQVLEGRIGADLALGRSADVVPELDALVREHPLRERFWAQRMAALYHSGRQGEALRAYAEVRALLADELGIEPGAELRELELRILDHDPTLSVPARAALAPSPAASVDFPEPLPTGTVTFVLTDIVGSTELWDRTPDEMAGALARHEALIDDAVSSNGGLVLKHRGEGDSTMSVFSRAADALAAAIALRDAVGAEAWPPGVELGTRVSVHTGEVETRDGDYYGPAVNRAARLRSIASGGEILCSRATADLVADRLAPGVTLTELGAVRLRGLRRNEVVYRVGRASDAETRVLPDGAAQDAPFREAPVRVDLRDEADLIAREAELARLVGALDVAGSGRAQVVFLRGDAGVGKTRLVHELVEQAATDVDVHVVACSPHSAAPLVALADLVELGAPSALEHREDVVALLRGGASGDDDADVIRLRCLTALRDAIRSLALERPAIVVLEDVHWAGPGLLDAIEFLVHDLVTARRDCKLVMVITRRTFAVAPDVESTLARLERLPGIRTMSLRPMSEVAVDDLLRGFGVDPPGRQLVGLMYERSRGNPLYVREALRRISDLDGFVSRGGRIETVVPATELGAPADLSELVERRLATLPDDVVDLLAVAAVAGDHFDAALLESVGGDRTEALLTTAARAGIVAETAAGYRFTHAVQRAALYDGLPRERRRMHHRTLAAALDRLPEQQRSAHLLALAHHLLEAGLDELPTHAAVDLWEAGRRAAAFADWGASARCYEGAIAIATRAGADPSTLAWMKYWAGGAHDNHYDAARALRRYDEAITVARTSGDIELWARAALAAATRTSITEKGAATGNFDPTLLTEALASLESGNPRLRARLLRKYAEMQYQAGDLDAGLVSAAEATELARTTADREVLLRCQSTLAYGHLFAGRASIAFEILTDVRRGTAAGATAVVEGFALARLALALLALGRLDDAERTAHEAFAVFDVARHLTGSCLAETILADTLFRLGDTEAAEEHARAAERLYRISEYSFVPSMLYPALAEARSAAGDIAGARDAITAWRASGERGSGLTDLLVTARSGDDDRARELLDRRAAALDGFLHPDAIAPGRLGALAELAWRLDRPDLAGRVLVALDALPDPAVVFGPGLPFHLATTRALSLAVVGDAAAPRAFDDAVGAADRIGARSAAARARSLRAAIYQRTN